MDVVDIGWEREKDCAYIFLIDSGREHEYGFEGLCGTGWDLISFSSPWQIIVGFGDLLCGAPFIVACKFSLF